MLLLSFLFVILALFAVGALVLLAVFFRIVIPMLVLMAVFLCFFTVVALYPISIIWAYFDAESRGKPGWAVALIVALSPFLALVGWPLCLLAWIVFRPKKNSAFSNIFTQAFGGAPSHP